MKNVVKKYCSVLVLLWYCISIIGFDVHTCNGSGRSFLANFISGMSCTDIHPGHVCGISYDEFSGHDGCCGHAGRLHSHCCCHVVEGTHDILADGTSAISFLAGASSDCCSDHYQVLSVTGLQQKDSHRHYDECHCGHCPCLGSHVSVLPQIPLIVRHSVSFGSGYPEPKDVDILASYGVWRI